MNERLMNNTHERTIAGINNLAEIAQFRKPELNENDKYKGVIIHKTKFVVFADWISF